MIVEGLKTVTEGHDLNGRLQGAQSLTASLCEMLSAIQTEQNHRVNPQRGNGLMYRTY